LRLSLAFGSALLAACSGASDDAPAPRVSPVYADAPHVVGAATDGALDLPFSLAAHGHGTSRIGSVALSAGVGSVEIDGREVPAAVIGRVPYAGQEVYQVLGVDAARWAVAWIYCAGGALSGVYLESTDAPGGVGSEPLSGACGAEATPTTVRVAFPAFDVTPPALPGRRFAVSGAGLEYDGTRPGAITIGGSTLAMYPFGIVDCTHGCADIGWYELHSLIWDSAARRASFGVLYLYVDPAFPLELAYTLTLPSLTRFGDALAFPGATWAQAE
jgi:hypothetical protein